MFLGKAAALLIHNYDEFVGEGPIRPRSEQGRATLLNLQHAIERDSRPVLHFVFHFDLIHHVAVDEIFQRPAQMLRRDAEHGSAKAS